MAGKYYVRSPAGKVNGPYSAETLRNLAKDGMLAPCPVPRELLDGRIPKELNGVPLHDPQGRWYGPILSSFGILANLRVAERRIGIDDGLRFSGDLYEREQVGGVREDERAWVAAEGL